MRIGLVGFFGWGNFGDELFFNLWKSLLKDHKTTRMNDLLAKPYFETSAIDRASSVDAVLIGGGDLVRIESISPLYWNRAWKDRPVIISGIGVARESNRIRADTVPRLAEFFSSNNILSISARDSASSDWISKNLTPRVPVRTISDLAFAISKPRHVVPKCPGQLESRPTIGFVLNKSEITNDDIQIWNRILISEAAGEVNVRLLVLAEGLQLSSELPILRSAEIIERAEIFSDHYEMIEAINSLDMLFSAKFHGLVVAARLGIPSVSLRSTSKAIALANSLPALVRVIQCSDEPLDKLSLTPVTERSEHLAQPCTNSALNELKHVRSIFDNLAANRAASDHP